MQKIMSNIFRHNTELGAKAIYVKYTESGRLGEGQIANVSSTIIVFEIQSLLKLLQVANET